MTTPPVQGEIPPLTAKDLNHLEGDPGRPQASRCRSVTFHWSAAEWGSLIAIARLGLEAQRWKAAAELATAGERGRAQELAAARRDLDEVLRMRADVVDRLTAYQVGVAAIVADAGLTSGAVRGRLSELLGARMAPIAGPHFDVVFDGPPGPEAGRFVEVEDDQGRGISIGHWVPPAKGAEHYPLQPPKVDEFWRLRITRAEVLARMPAPVEEVPESPAEPVTSLRPVGAIAENAYQYGMLFLRGRQPEPQEWLVWKAICVDGIVVKHAYGELGPMAQWAEVTRQLGERVAKLEAVSKLAERQVDPVLAAMETVMLDPEPDQALDDLTSALGYAPDSIDWKRGLDLVRETIAQRNAARAELARIPLNWMEIATVREADLQEAARTVDGLKLQLEERRRSLCAVLELNADWHGSDWESLVSKVDRLQRAHAIRGIDRADVEAGQKWIAELTDKLTTAEHRITDQAATIERLQNTEERTLAQKIADAEIKTLQRERDKLKLDLEMARDDREQAEQDAEAGATMIARSERRQAELQQWRSTGTEWRRQLAGALGVDLGTTESPIAPPSMADLLLDVRQIVVKAGQIDSDAARVLKLETMIADAARQLSSAVGDGRPCSLTEAVDRVLHVLDKICANLGQRQDGETIQAQAGRVAVELAEAESQLANERAAALEQAKVKGRREADVERAALVAKLQLVREVCGVNASLDAPGGDNVVERVRALADQLGQVCEALKTEDAAHVVDEVRALVESEAKWEAAHAKIARDIETEQKLLADNRRQLAEIHGEYNALLVQMHRIREALRIPVGELHAEEVADRAIGCVRIADEEVRWKSEHAKVKHELDSYIGTIEGEHSPRPGHARVTIHLWSCAAAAPGVDQPDYGLIVDLGTDTIAEFRTKAARHTARLLAKWGQPGTLPTVAGTIRELYSSPPTVDSPDPGRFAEGIGRMLDERRGKLESGLEPLAEPIGTVDAKLGTLLPSLAKLPRPPALLASEQILREVIAAALASGPVPADVFEVRHRPADAETPPRTELHVFAGKGPTTATTQVLAYVELGQLWIIALEGVAGYCMALHLAKYLRWPERIRAALDRK